MYEPTGELRWIKRGGHMIAGAGGYPMRVEFERVLQQAWVCPETGRVEWKDVPEVLCDD